MLYSSKASGLKKASFVDAGGNPLKIAQAIHTGGSQAVPDRPSTDGARVSVAGLLSSWARLASCMFTPFNPSCKARSSTAANFIRSVHVWPFLWDSVSAGWGGVQWELGENWSSKSSLHPFLSSSLAYFTHC